MGLPAVCEYRRLLEPSSGEPRAALLDRLPPSGVAPCSPAEPVALLGAACGDRRAASPRPACPLVPAGPRPPPALPAAAALVPSGAELVPWLLEAATRRWADAAAAAAAAAAASRALAGGRRVLVERLVPLLGRRRRLGLALSGPAGAGRRES